MIYNAILAAAIATRLGGDCERVVELFHDNTLHAELAAYQGVSEFRFREALNN